jgi:uncharacterized membrane protein (DUF2068 family)
MSAEKSVTKATLAAKAVQPPVKKRAPTLYAIIVFKLLKGVLCVALALVIWHEARHDLSEDWDKFLHSPFITTVFGELKIHPESKFFIELAKTIDRLTESNMYQAAWGAVILSLFPLVEGIGLIFRVSWAGWLAIGESAFFLPIEFYELVKPKTFSWSILGVTIVNIIIVWYLYDNRNVLFRHHIPNPSLPEPNQPNPGAEI